MSIVPLKLAAKYSPPTIAVFYSKGSRRFLHEFQLHPDDLVHPTELIVNSLVEEYPEFLSQVESHQISKFVSMLQKNQPKLAAINRRIDNLALDSSESDPHDVQFDSFDDSGSDDLY